MEEKALRDRWGARKEHVEADAKGVLWSGREEDNWTQRRHAWGGRKSLIYGTCW